VNLLCVNTGGAGGQDGLRMRRLAGRLKGWNITCFDLDRGDRRGAANDLWDLLRSRSWDLVYQEGTGIAGGLNLIRAARSRSRQRYVVSSGDPISGFFRATRGAGIATAFAAYDRSLYRHSAGFIGWTPYLAGRALELGAPRAVTVEGAVALDIFKPLSAAERAAARERFGLPQDHLVCGVVGSLTWVPRQKYCYGLELVETIQRVKRRDLTMLIVGDGQGKAIMQERIPESLRSRVVFTGRLPEADVVQAMNAMDVGFITQTLDQLGSYRLTTKMPEYLACGLPIAISPIPGYFDYVGDAGWPLPPYHPASAAFAEHCAAWLDELCKEEIRERSARCRPIAEARFSYDVVGPRFERFIEHLVSSAAQ
jgi:hypothetical protein